MTTGQVSCYGIGQIIHSRHHINNLSPESFPYDIIGNLDASIYPIGFATKNATSPPTATCEK